MKNLVAGKLPLIQKTIKTKIDWFTLIALGDVHIGHINCDEKAANEMIKYIAGKDPANYGVILTGDLIENVLPTSKGSLFEMSIPDPDQQIDKTIEMFSPIKKHILMMCDGNHEDRSVRTCGLSPSKIIARGLDVNYVGYHGLLELNLECNKHKEVYNIYTEHGCGSIPKSVSGRYGKLESIQKQVEADVYLKGHIHHKNVFAKEVWKKIGRSMVKRKVMFASNGSYLMDAEYAIRSGYEPTTPGVAKILLSTSVFNIHSSI